MIAGHLRPRQQLAMAGGDEIGADASPDVATAIVVEFGDADPFHRGMTHGHLAAKQADAAGANNGKPDTLRGFFHTFSHARFFAFSSAMPEIVSLVSGKSIGSLRSAERSAAL